MAAAVLWDEFVEILSLEYADDILDAPLVRDSRLIDDLGLDSLQLIRLSLVVESLGSRRIPVQLNLLDATLGDIYYYELRLDD